MQIVLILYVMASNNDSRCDQQWSPLWTSLCQTLSDLTVLIFIHVENKLISPITMEVL